MTRPNASATAKPSAAASDANSLFDGKTLAGWKDSGFVGAGETKVEPNFRGQCPVILHLMGLDHEKPTYFLEQRITGVRGKVIKKALA